MNKLLLTALVGLAAMLALMGTAFFPSTQPTATPDLVVDGEEVYMTRCLSCHQMTGEGVPGVFPPLNGTDYVTGDKGRLIRLILNGMSGELTINGTTYGGMMPPWGAFLDDQQVADVLTYIRTSFGNEAPAVTPEEVAKVRAIVAERKETWTAAELELEENQGIPE